MNKNLNKAKSAKNDEFYTQISDIENEVKHYREHFENKTVFLNCDDPEWSDFWKFFANDFKFLKLKKLIATHYEADKPSYKLELTLKEGEDELHKDGDWYNGEQYGYHNDLLIKKTDLRQDGDFRSPESIEILKEADIVVTNPPFSLFREYISLLDEHNKKFLIIGSKNAITYKDTFSLIKDNKVWVGVNLVKEFTKPDGSTQKFGNIGWFTNLEHNKRKQELFLYRDINDDEIDYPKYDNYDAINIDKVADIPKDYYGEMGVPISFLDKHNPNQFEIIDADGNVVKTDTTVHKQRFVLNGKAKYARIVIKRRKENENKTN